MDRSDDPSSPPQIGQVGLEIEMLAVAPDRGAAVPAIVPLQGVGRTAASVLQSAAQKHGWQLDSSSGDDERPLLMRVALDDGDQITFEPGGQVEFSSRPYSCLNDALRRMKTVQDQLDDAFAANGISLVQIGVNPWHTLQELGLQMPKSRYRAMDRYYASIGPYGQQMMRQSCTLQVNLDFGPDESTLVRRYIASQLLAPVAAATFALSPVIARQNSGIRGYRTRIWRHTDPTHTGLPTVSSIAGLTDADLASHFRRDALIEEYLDFVLKAQVVFIAGLNYRSPQITFGQWLEHPVEGVSPTVEDFAVHLTLMFPEVRPRGFLELRSVDCQARPFACVPAAYWSGLLYDDKALDGLLALLLPERGRLNDLLTKAEDGLAHPALRTLAQAVAELAQSGLASLPLCFKADGVERALQAFVGHFTARGRTPADDVLDLLRREQSQFPSFAGYQALVGDWSKLVT
jgi:glutamate--cysteine ligase